MPFRWFRVNGSAYVAVHRTVQLKIEARARAAPEKVEGQSVQTFHLHTSSRFRALIIFPSQTDGKITKVTDRGNGRSKPDLILQDVDWMASKVLAPELGAGLLVSSWDYRSNLCRNGNRSIL